MGFASDVFADLIEVQLHGPGVGGWQHQRCSRAALGTDGSEQIGVLVALIGKQAWSRAFPGPDAYPPILLSNPCFVLKPNLDRCALRQVGYMGCERVGEVFLKALITSGFCAGCWGRPEMWEKPSLFK